MSLFFRRAVAGVAVCLLLALLIAPKTRWLVRKQMLISIGRYHLLPFNNGAYTASPAEDRQRIEAAAASAPNDFGLHYAALNGPGYVGAAAGLRGLVSHFPSEPALYANILRYDSTGAVRLVRPEGSLLTGIKPDSEYHPKPATPAALAAFERTTAAGEQVDPNNAYFPLMRAVGLLAAHRDAEAEAAVRRAATKTAWREYITDDIQSRWRLHEIAFGDKGVIPQVSVASDTLLPQYQRMRDVARVLTYRAMQKEQAGDVAGGLTLRESLRRCGDLLRVQSNFLIGAIVGSSLCEIACLRPGGAPPPPEPPSNATDTQQSARDHSNALAFAAYARQHGRADLATKALAEAEAGARVSAIEASIKFNDSLVLEPINRLVNWWTADVAVLANVFWLLALWTLTQLVHAGRRLGLCDALRRISWRTLWQENVWRKVVLFGLALLALGGLYFALLWQTQGIWATWVAELYFWPDAAPFDAHDDSRRRLFQGLSIMLALIAPFLLMLGAALAARLRPAPRMARFGASLRVLAPATACVLLLVYGGLVLATLRQESVVRRQLEATVQGSGQYFAARAGLPWPGPVR